MMKIGFIVPSLANKGPILVVKDLVEQLIEHGYTCHVFYLTDIVEVEMKCNVQKIRFTEIIEFHYYDIIHSHGLRPDAYVFLHRPWNTKVKFISTIHNYVISDFSFQYNKLVAYTLGNLWMMLLGRHDRIVTLSKDAMKYYSKWFSVKKLSYVYNTRSVDKDRCLTVKEQEELVAFKGDSVLIGANALLTRRKGIDLLIRALPKLAQCKLCIVGKGYIMNELISLAKNLEVYDKCLFVGYKKDAYRYLPYYDIYAMPSRSEGFPLSILEAALFHKKIVCSDISILKEIFTPEEVTFFQLENVDSLVDSIQLCLGNAEQGELVFRCYMSKYSPKIFFESYISIYQNIR